MNIILASASPRRKEILENTNVKFKIMASSIEELRLEGESPCQMVMRLAFEKGIDIASRQKSDLVISADTIVVLDNTVLGKPKDEIEARKMITSLSGRTHQVITGISLINLDNNKKIIDYVISNVKFKNLSEEDINDYIIYIFITALQVQNESLQSIVANMFESFYYDIEKQKKQIAAIFNL